MCIECYIDENRITPLLNPIECLQNHTQYICGTCGRCICIEHDPKRGLQRWNFPFKSLEIAKMYLRTADYSMKKSCGIYEIESENGRLSYKIFANNEDLQLYPSIIFWAYQKNHANQRRMRSQVEVSQVYWLFVASAISQREVSPYRL